MKRLTETWSIAVLAAVLAGCATPETVPPPGATDEYVFACGGAAADWADCEDRINQACLNGYETLSEEKGLNQTEVRIRCDLE